MTNYFEQRPLERIDYVQSLVKDTIASATASIAPSGPTLDPVCITDSEATVRVSDVAAGVLYTLTFHIVGASGQEWHPPTQIRGIR